MQVGRAVLNAARGAHEGVACDASGMDPILGTRYHLRGSGGLLGGGASYDLCQAEFDKLGAEEQRKYEAMAPSSKLVVGGGMCRFVPFGWTDDDGEPIEDEDELDEDQIEELKRAETSPLFGDRAPIARQASLAAQSRPQHPKQLLGSSAARDASGRVEMS